MKGTLRAVSAAAFVVASCSAPPALSPAAPAAPAATAAATAIHTPTVALTATPTALPTATPFVPKANIKIFLNVPLSGDLSNYGVDIQRAAEMAAKQLAGPLNDLGYSVELASYDDRADVVTGVENARQFVKDEEVLCGVGNFNSTVTLQASEIYHQAGLAFITPSSSAPAVTDRGYLEANRLTGRDDAQGMAAARFAQAQGSTKAFVISSSSPYGMKNSEYFRREAYGSGVQIAGSVVTDRWNEFDAIIQDIMSAESDLVYFAGWLGQGGEFIREARAAGYNGVVLGLDAFDTPELINLAGPLLVDGGGTYYTTVLAPADAYPYAEQFARDFEMLHGTAPMAYAAHGYDAVGLCLEAIGQASQAKNGELPTRKEVASAVRAVKDYEGITGTYNFNSKGDPALLTYFVYKVGSIDPKQWAANIRAAAFELAPPK